MVGAHGDGRLASSSVPEPSGAAAGSTSSYLPRGPSVIDSGLWGRGCPDPSPTHSDRHQEAQTQRPSKVMPTPLSAAVGPQARATYLPSSVLSTLANPLTPHKGPRIGTTLLPIYR